MPYFWNYSKECFFHVEHFTLLIRVKCIFDIAWERAIRSLKVSLPKSNILLSSGRRHLAFGGFLDFSSKICNTVKGKELWELHTKTSGEPVVLHYCCSLTMLVCVIMSIPSLSISSHFQINLDCLSACIYLGCSSPPQ